MGIMMAWIVHAWCSVAWSLAPIAVRQQGLLAKAVQRM